MAAHRRALAKYEADRSSPSGSLVLELRIDEPRLSVGAQTDLGAKLVSMPKTRVDFDKSTVDLGQVTAEAPLSGVLVSTRLCSWSTTSTTDAAAKQHGLTADLTPRGWLSGLDLRSLRGSILPTPTLLQGWGSTGTVRGATAAKRAEDNGEST